MYGNGLFGVDTSGKVFYLGDGHSKRWEKLPYVGLDIKRVSASERSLWAIGSDHRIYVFVFETEVPIRVKETTYENQRWKPVLGFSNSLLPTDRSPWSTSDGLKTKTRESVKKPSLAWQWESEWYLENTYNGTRLEDESWTYAVDFPSEYHPSKGFTSCVRRRKWCRYRKYVALQTWAPIPSIHEDISQEPLIDVCVGGAELPNGDPDEVFVWSVTILGRVMVRQGVTSLSPEGCGWLHIPTPNECEVSAISIGPCGLVWAITWQGKALVRLGVSRINPTGIRWTQLDSPSASPLVQVSVGANAVWALTRDHCVWFRNGIRSSRTVDNDTLAIGSKWIQMVGELQMLSLSPFDQVIGIRADEDRPIIFRTGIYKSDLCGKTWRPLAAEVTYEDEYPVLQNRGTQRVVAGSSNANFFSSKPCDEITAEPEQSNVDYKKKAFNIGNKVAQKVVSTTASSILGRIPVVGPVISIASRDVINEELQNLKIFNDDADVDDGNVGSTDTVASETKEDSALINESMYVSALEELPPTVPAEKEKTSRRIRYDSSSSCSSEIPVIDREDEQGYSAIASATRWLWISSSSSRYDSPPSFWFNENSLSLSDEPWRRDILNDLKKNNSRTNGTQFQGYESMMEHSSWVKKGQCSVLTYSRNWEGCVLELEQTKSNDHAGEPIFGTLSIFGLKKVKEHISTSEITAVCQTGEKTLSVYTSNRNLELCPVQLKFNSSSEKETWQTHLISGVNQIRNTCGTPGKGSVFSVTQNGEVCVFDPKSAEANANNKTTRSDHDGEMPLFSQTLPVAMKTPPFFIRLENGFLYGSMLEFVVDVNMDAKKFCFNLTNEPASPNGRPSIIYFHFNPRFDTNNVVLNTYNSGFWGSEEMGPVFLMNEAGDAEKSFSPGTSVTILIKADENHFQVIVNGAPYVKFNYRHAVEDITHLEIWGDILLSSVVYHSKTALLAPYDMYWRVIGGGHLSKVSSCQLSGLVWGIGYDFTPWVYTKGWGGAHFKDVDASGDSGVHPMTDTKYYYIFENQRWNPLTGFTAHGLLPTDRSSWSNKSGRVSLTKDNIKPPSIHWKWATDWIVSFDTPGGVDKDGWQYASDFPNKYQGKSSTFDYVRRRRWMKKAKLVTTGPWKKLGSTKLVDMSFGCQVHSDGSVDVWAVSIKGEALSRKNVSQSQPEGTEWEPHPGDVPFQSISCTTDGKNVWAIGKDGNAYFLSKKYQLWMQIHPPTGVYLKSIEAGNWETLWAIDSELRLYLRREISEIRPEGCGWTSPVCPESVKDISVSINGELWGVLESVKIRGQIVYDVMARRTGMTSTLPQGTAWEYVIGPGWKQLCVRSMDRKNME
uniref:Tectonin betapropeller repeatcontaining proteinlike [Megachile rotundata] n=1 Tax=Lepeophtheirus salmonis TaxID=72036 RepID=A0A0K2T4H6_LEPSM